MRTQLIILMLMAMCINLRSQNIVYDSEGAKMTFKSEDIDIFFTGSNIKFPEKGQEVAGALLAILPVIVDMGFQLTTDILEKRAKKFSAEYSKQKSYMEAGDRLVPNFTFVRTVVMDKDPVEALSIHVLAESVPNMEGFVYYINSINLLKSSAKAVRSSKVFDYTLEIKPTLLIDGEKKVIELSPIAISSVKFGENLYPKLKHRTDIIARPANAVMTEVSLKIVESNPRKVRAEKILSVWNTHKDNVKTIVNNFLPEEKSEENNPNTGTGNE